MKSGIWQLAIPCLLSVSLSAQVLADDRRDGSPLDELRNDRPQQNQQRQAERQQQQQIQQQNNQQRNVERQQQQQIYQQQQNQQRQIQQQQNQQRQVERQQERQIQQQQNQQRDFERQQQQQRFDQQRDQQRQIQDQQNQQRQIQRQQLQQDQNRLPIQGRPDQVWQTQPPRQGYYRDLPRDQRPRENWPGRPDGRGDGWGGGPRYNPGYSIDRVPGGYSRVPWRGQDYYYAEGYWYRPQGSRYVVVTPPYGVRVRSLPSYSREVWVGGSLLFLAAGAYYAWQADSQDYVVVNPPQQVQYTQVQAGGNGYDPQFSPIAGQTAQQVEFDRYQCYQEAVQQSGFDPANITYQPAAQVVETYRRAMGACLYERGYSVQ